mgnify:CR=1 FL=1
MKLCELMRDTGVLPGPFPEREELKGLSCDSRRVEPGFAFVCIRGTAVDGHEYVRQAVENGAAVRRNVTVGLYDNETTAITGGLDVGEEVITTWSAGLRDGAPVRIWNDLEET